MWSSLWWCFGGWTQLGLNWLLERVSDPSREHARSRTISSTPRKPPGSHICSFRFFPQHPQRWYRSIEYATEGKPRSGTRGVPRPVVRLSELFGRFEARSVGRKQSSVQEVSIMWRATRSDLVAAFSHFWHWLDSRMRYSNVLWDALFLSTLSHSPVSRFSRSRISSSQDNPA